MSGIGIGPVGHFVGVYGACINYTAFESDDSRHFATLTVNWRLSMAPLFENKKGLITGVFNKQSIAWAIAEQILDDGGECGFSYMPDKPDDERKKNLGRLSKLTDGNPRCSSSSRWTSPTTSTSPT